MGAYLQAVLIVAAGALVAAVLYLAFGATRLSAVFLGTVLIAALRLGVRPGIAAAAASFVVYLYLVEPFPGVRLRSAEDVTMLSLFLAVALLTGGLAGKVRDERETARARARELSILFDAGRALSATESEPGLREQLARTVAAAAGSEVRLQFEDGPAGAVTAGEQLAGEQAGAEAVERLLLDHGRPLETVRCGVWRARFLQVDDRRLGRALWRAPAARGAPGAPPDTPELDKFVAVLVDLGAAAIARARVSRERSEVEAMRRTESLRTALLSSMSHDFRTPIAAVLASASSLLEYGDRFAPEVREDLLRNIQEEAERLNRFVVNLLNMTRIESGVLEIQRSTFPVGEAIAGVRRRLGKRYGAERLVAEVADAELEVRADLLLLEQSLENIADNALKLSPEEARVTITADRIGDHVTVSVSDHGDGVPAADLPRLFHKFYRASNARAAARGTGLGLAIARGLIEAMDGAVEARARPDGRSGLVVLISLPAAA
jgi:two-component system sensor histidine kinase KdpD